MVLKVLNLRLRKTVNRMAFGDIITSNGESNYHTMIVAIPNDFDIEKYLSLREQAGLFDNKLIQKADLLFLSNAVRLSTIFKFFSGEIPHCTITYFIDILKELGVIIDVVTSDYRTHNIVSINVLADGLNEMVIKAIKNIVDIEETM